MLRCQIKITVFIYLLLLATTIFPTSAVGEIEWVRPILSLDYAKAGALTVDSNGNATWSYWYVQGSHIFLQLKRFKSNGLEFRQTPSVQFGSALDVHFLTTNKVIVGSGNFEAPNGNILLFEITSNDLAVLWPESGPGGYSWNTGSTEYQENLGRSYIINDQMSNTVIVFPYTSLNLGGESEENTQSFNDVGILKLSPSGEAIWLRKVEGRGTEVPTGIVMSSEGNYVISGYSTGNTVFGPTVLTNYSGYDFGSSDGFVTMVSPEGNFIWSQKFAGAREDKVAGVSQTGRGTFWVYGDYSGDILLGTSHYTSPQTNGYACEVNENGVVLRSFRFLLPIKKLVESPDGQLIIAGTFSGDQTLEGGVSLKSKGNEDVYVLSYDPTSGVKWAKSFGYFYSDLFNDLYLSATGEIYLSGTAVNGLFYDSNYVPNDGSRMPFLVKIDSNLVPLPVIIDEPKATNSYVGGQVSFSLHLANSIGVFYQWYFNNVAITGATNQIYTINSIKREDEGYYHVEIHNDAGVVRSDSALLSIFGAFPVQVSTLAGGTQPGYVDSENREQARFNHPSSIAIVRPGVIAVADEWNHVIRQVDLFSGAVSTLAGSNIRGYLNGDAAIARFNYPAGITTNPGGNLVVAEYGNSVIRLVETLGSKEVTTLAGTGILGYLDGPISNAKFGLPTAVAVSPNGTVYATELSNHTVRVISPDGVVSTLAGSGLPGYADGASTNAQFNQPSGITLAPDGNLYVTERVGNRIRRITPQGVVTTLAGTNLAGFKDGQGITSRFNKPAGITSDLLGNLYVCDGGNHAIRKIDPIGDVLTIAGRGTAGSLDGDGSTSMFNYPSGITCDSSGILYVADNLNNSIRKITFLEETNMPTTELRISLNPAITIFGEQGKTYRIEFAEETTPLAWDPVATIFMTNSVQIWHDDQPATKTKRLYRAVRLN